MISVIREYENHDSYITRESLGESKSGRGISHILVDPSIDDMYVGGCVDKIVASGAFSTDHHIIAADFAFNMEDIHLQNGDPIERFKWGRMANILMELIPTTKPDIPPALQPKHDTPHTAEWEQNLQLYQDLHHLLENDIELCAAAESFHCQMLSLQQTPISASAQLTPDEQGNCALIKRDPHYKSSLEDAWDAFMTSLKKAATKLGLRSEDDPIERLKENINTYRNPNDLVGKHRSVATFTSIIGHARYLRATYKALDRLGKKIKHIKPNQPAYTKYTDHMTHLTNKLAKQADQYHIGERLIEAIESAELKQTEREIIQSCFERHRMFDKFYGFNRAANTTNLSAEKTLAVNDILKKAQYNHIFDTDRDPVCEIIACEDVREWNAIKKATVDAEENHKRYSDLFLDKDFYTAISQTIANLESLTSMTVNQRLKFKRLHIRHAALRVFN